MPLSPARTIIQMRPGSWPPAPGRQPAILDDDNSTDDDDDDEFDLPLLQRDPMSYFLTPATPDDDELEFNFDLDAGIEDTNRPQEIVRSVSPSTLDGLKRYKSSSKRDDCAIVDDESDDDEDYIRFRPSKSYPLSLPDFGFDRLKFTSPGRPRTDESMLSPPAFHVGAPRGRTIKFSPPRSPLQSRSRSLPLQRRHSWMEPSADVWSIDEEPEKETLSESGMSTEDLNAYFSEQKSLPIDIPAAKPKKRVRFVLPVKE